ncbi:MAG: ATP synthase F1 subunit delta [Chthonomonadales bacterium]|nr:ATP synthase F1 subunit delta [Chthonomonadales bacterium]
MTGLREGRVARRYAGALFGAARRLGRVAEVDADLESILAARRDSPAFRQVLESPLIPAERKKLIMDRALAGVEPLTRAFVDLLISKRRTDALPAIREEYRRCADEAAGIARVEVTVAAPITDAELAQLRAALEARCGSRVAMHVRVEPAVLGGVIARIGDTVWDGSVRGALETMREEMLAESAVVAASAA